MNNMNKPIEIIFGINKGEISKKIQRIENSIVGVDYKSPKKTDDGIIIEGMPIPNSEEKKPLTDRMAEFKIHGLCIAVIDNFEVEWAKSYGVINIHKENSITLETIFQAASITKVIMSMMALHLVEKKLLNLDEPVNNKLKDWKIPDSEFTKEKEITLRYLLSHTSGINPPDGGFGREEGSSPTIIQTLKGELPAKNHSVKVMFEPGSKHSYSNFGFIIIEKLLEDVTGKRLNDIANEIIFEPLGMSNSFLLFPSKEIQKRMVNPHDATGKDYEPHIGLSPQVFGCGGLLTTPLDLTKILIEIMNAFQGKSNKILSTPMVKEMLTRVVPLDPLKMWGLTGQGLGVFLSEWNDTFFLDHKGSNYPGSSGVMMANPKSGQGVVIMANGVNGHELFESIKFTVAQEYGWPVWSN
ncbi:MAG TPA: serine hydrolase domain-containing protein [candidate division Zixibacteria bacterium]|nr:serine hydrolase domain-containing protein [candidate division Zixibacteria bacterium]